MGIPPLTVRRLVIDPLFVPVALVAAVLGAVAALLGLLSVPVDRRLRVPRVCLLVAVYLLAEAVLITAAFGLWLARPLLRRRWEAANLVLLRGTLDRIVAAARLLVGLRMVVVEPPEGSVDTAALPVLVLSRHAGPGDSFVLVHLLISRYRLTPRIVLLATLQLDPAIDILLHRLGACFLRTDNSDDRSVDQIAQLAGRLSGPEALVIFPEGANFTPLRRSRLIAKLRARGQVERAAVAEDFDAVLPPRPAGVLAALDAGSSAATVIVAHAGLDEFREPGQVWRALPFAVPLVLRWWWVPAADVPRGVEDRREWLTMHWAVVNAWIDARRAGVDDVTGRVAGSPAPHGGPAGGAASDGAAGAASDGAASDGAASDGAASDGAASDGAASDGATRDGAAGDGAAGDGGEVRIDGPS